MSLRVPNFDESDSAQVINISPLIDVIFILLIFFIVTMTFADTSALLIDKPESTTSEVLNKANITIQISESGEVFFNSENLNLQSLAQKLSPYSTGEEFSVILEAHANAPVQKLVDVMDCVKENGATKIYISSKRK